jgi:GNAT superfamily N-acetyltransferase
MRITELAPDIFFPQLPGTPDNLSFSFAVKRAAIGPYVERKWGWDNDYQFAVHRRRFDEKPFFAIERDGARIGIVSLSKQDTFLRFGEFYLIPTRQRTGLGTRILTHCLAMADALRLPVRLEYLKWNPVGSLYKRHGFEITGDTDIHWLMERPVYGNGAEHSGR